MKPLVDKFVEKKDYGNETTVSVEMFMVFFRDIRASWLSYVIFTLLGFGVAAFNIYITPPQYRGTMIMQFPAVAAENVSKAYAVFAMSIQNIQFDLMQNYFYTTDILSSCQASNADAVTKRIKLNNYGRDRMLLTYAGSSPSQTFDCLYAIGHKIQRNHDESVSPILKILKAQIEETHDRLKHQNRIRNKLESYIKDPNFTQNTNNLMLDLFIQSEGAAINYRQFQLDSAILEEASQGVVYYQIGRAHV